MYIKVAHKEINPIKHELEMEFPWEEIEKRIPDVIKEYKTNNEIKGFRKGKAPDGVVRAQIGEKQLLKHAAEKAAHDAFNEVVKDFEKKPIIPPQIDLDDVQKDQPVRFKVEYYIEPPDPQKLAKELQEKHVPGMVSPEDVFPSGPPGIQSHGPYGVSIDAFKSIPGVDLGDKFIPKVGPSIPNPQAGLPEPPKTQPEIPDPERLKAPLKVQPTISKSLEEKEKSTKSKKEIKKTSTESDGETAPK